MVLVEIGYFCRIFNTQPSETVGWISSFKSKDNFSCTCRRSAQIGKGGFVEWHHWYVESTSNSMWFGVFILAGCNGVPEPGCLLSCEQDNISSSIVHLKRIEICGPWDTLQSQWKLSKRGLSGNLLLNTTKNTKVGVSLIWLSNTVHMCTKSWVESKGCFMGCVLACCIAISQLFPSVLSWLENYWRNLKKGA